MCVAAQPPFLRVKTSTRLHSFQAAFRSVPGFGFLRSPCVSLSSRPISARGSQKPKTSENVLSADLPTRHFCGPGAKTLFLRLGTTHSWLSPSPRRNSPNKNGGPLLAKGRRRLTPVCQKVPSAIPHLTHSLPPTLLDTTRLLDTFGQMWSLPG